MLLRRATRADLERLRAWAADFWHGAPPAAFVATTLAVFEEHPERGGVFVLEDAAPVGYTVLARFWSNEFGGEALLVDELYVAPEHRGGRGSAALAAIEEHARSLGVKLLQLEVLPDADRVHALYKRAGFVSGRTLYQKKL